MIVRPPLQASGVIASTAGMVRSLGDFVFFVHRVLMDKRAGVVHFGSTMTAEEQEIESSLHAVRGTSCP